MKATDGTRLTGGIGGRGPGETKLEIGRRRAKERVQHLETELKELSKRRTQRQSRWPKSHQSHKPLRHRHHPRRLR